MSASTTFNDFLTGFLHLFTSKSFKGGDYLTYLRRSDRSGDEAPIVDTAIVGPLLGLLGFEPAERVYNQQRQNDRPDFTPTIPVYDICFVVEDKSTALALTFDLAEPSSHLSQLARYIRSTAVRFGWLTNGRQFTVWSFETAHKPVCLIDIDIPTAVQAWQSDGQLQPSTETALHTLFDLCRKEAFSDLHRLEQEIGTSYEAWYAQALPLGIDNTNEVVLVEALQSLVKELQRDARRLLEGYLTRYATYAEQVTRLADDAHEPAAQKLREQREKILSIIVTTCQVIWGLDTQDIVTIETILTQLEQNVNTFFSPKEVLTALLGVVNEARRRKYATKPKAAQPMSNFHDVPALSDSIHIYCDTAFAWHKRQATLNHDSQVERGVHEDYTVWALLVRETMLGGLNEEQRREEFALQAAYVVFIRLLLIRVCEDKGVFPNRFISDGELKHWQDDIKRYFVFATGNPYDPLLDMAYANAQNIYAHFFTGRELFNWYRLDREHFVMALHRLSRFNFAGVDSDIIGTIYNTYVSRKEKREKGQYYTPTEIVNYILDEVGYIGKAMIGSQKRLLDPACGSGSFLVTAAKRFISAYRNKDGRIEDPLAVLQRLQQNIFGFDLNPFACYLAEVNLLIQVLDVVKQAHDMGQRPTIQRFHIYNVDALTRSTGRYYYAHFNTLLAQENDQVDQIKSRAENTAYANGFAFVVANPPYGATLSDSYKDTLRTDWADVFYGQPDTYTFFLKFGVELLANNGRLGFITPNTYLMGKNTAALRYTLLTTGRIEQIVDLPQGIWQDVNVDCVLLFLTEERDEQKRKAQQVQINLLGLRDTLDKLIQRRWAEALTQQQVAWMTHTKYEITIRHDTLLQQIEDACLVPIDNTSTMKVLRLGDITESTQGIIPYVTQEEGNKNAYIKPYREVPFAETDWKPLLDGSAFVGRYELRWGEKKLYLKYGNWLGRSREVKYFEAPKLIVQYMRNRALKRRLVATFDDQKFYNRHNFSNIILGNTQHDLKYNLALFNSSLLNYWFARKFDNVNINPSYFRQLPIYPADATTQASLVALVDAILAKNAELNSLREQGYVIRQQRNGATLIEVPYDQLVNELQASNPYYPMITLFDAKATDLFSIPERCDLQATISSNVYVPAKYPTTLVLRHNKLWFEIVDEAFRTYLLGYLRHPRWQGKTWDDLKSSVFVPEDADALQALFVLEEQKKHHLLALLAESKQIDAEIDERVLDLYGITSPTDRQRILGSAPLEEEIDSEEQSLEDGE